jgi:hypothetical protein
MNIGNNFIGFSLQSDYLSFRMFPLCFDIHVLNIVMFSLYIFSFNITITFSIENIF